MTRITTSRKVAIGILVSTFLLSVLCALKELESFGTAVWSTGIISGTALYANKQLQERKTIEATNKNIE